MGLKTQTRRLPADQPLKWCVRFEPAPFEGYGREPGWIQMTADAYSQRGWCNFPYGKVGDHLWVRETFTYGPDGELLYAANFENHTNHGGTTVIMSRDGKRQVALRWKPSIFMPRSASRILLEITAIRVERLQDISLDDINAEGTPDTLDPTKRPYGTRREQFQRLWDSINAKKYPFESNPWVWVIEFKKVEA